MQIAIFDNISFQQILLVKKRLSQWLNSLFYIPEQSTPDNYADCLLNTVPSDIFIKLVLTVYIYLLEVTNCKKAMVLSSKLLRLGLY